MRDIIRVAMSVALAASALSGCNGPSGLAENGATATTTGTARDAARPDDIKQSGYVGSFNALERDGWLAQAADAYAAYNIPNATAASTIGIRFVTDPLVQTIESLKKTRVLPGTSRTAPLDQAADALLPPLEEIVRFERDLGPYYASRAYREDDVARGKAADGPLKAAHARALAALGRLGDALSDYQRVRSAERITELERAGHVAEASLVKAMGVAEAMADAYAKDDIAATARQSQALGAAIDRMRANQGRLAKIQSNDIYYESVIKALTDMRGMFSDVQNGDKTAASRVLTQYNAAVRSSNSFRFPE